MSEYTILKAAASDPRLLEEFRLELARGLADIGTDGIGEYMSWLKVATPLDDAVEKKAAPSYEELTLNVGDATLTVEVADDDGKRTLGLSGRKKLAEDRGMLFAPAGAYWMKGCNFDLDVMFIDKEAQVVDIQTMRCDDPDKVHVSQAGGSAILAVEAPAGWCERNGVEVGAEIL